MDKLFLKDMTFDGSRYADELFVSDRIHLNHDGQLKWCQNYIHPLISRLVEEYGLDTVRK